MGCINYINSAKALTNSLLPPPPTHTQTPHTPSLGESSAETPFAGCRCTILDEKIQQTSSWKGVSLRVFLNYKAGGIVVMRHFYGKSHSELNLLRREVFKAERKLRTCGF